MKFLLTDKDLSKLREKPCQTDWMEFAEEFDNKLSAVPLPLSAHLGKRLQGVTFCISVYEVPTPSCLFFIASPCK